MGELEKRTMSKVSARLIPLLIICYFIAYLDRVNLSFAALEMNKDLNFSATIYGNGAGIFFLSYFLLETPSNLILVRVGARRWIARIMFTWGILSGCMAFITGETSFYAVRFLLGAAEAGFFPGIIFYLTLWFPAAYRGRIISLFMTAIPLSAVVGAPLSSLLLYLDGGFGLKGWQWIFILEAIPSLIFSVVIYFYLTERPSEATWLATDERAWLVARQNNERIHRESVVNQSVLQALTNPKVLALGVAGISIAYSIYGLSYFLPQVVKAFGVTNMQTGLITAIPFAVGMVSMIWYGRRSDRLMERRSHTAIALLITGLGIGAAAVISDPYIKMAWLCVAGFGAFAVLPVFWSMPTAFLSGTAAAAGIAFINSIANIAGFVGPMIIGRIKDATGSFSGGFLVIAGISVVAAIVMLCIGHDKALEQVPEPVSDLEPLPGAAPAE